MEQTNMEQVLPASETKTLRMSYARSPQWRVILSEGVVGGMTPRGMIRIGFFTETNHMPTEMEFEAKIVTGGVRPGKEIRRIQQPGILREIETEVIMSLENAKAFRTWLDNHIAKLEKKRSDKEAAKAAAASETKTS